ncbi:glycerol-3-phosphate acyltransferase [Agrilactobacillus yilanensis]|uniref:Glycerol-3-phosphate acyltransferase n=1 Tax=Agrilactobacillus yilanensis TaxID=2485997 RepID=A0ABW4J6J9_9LACO|nr:glycerol-3-phosphate acyltransferase [Agrilactobacillus yilanensis]
MTQLYSILIGYAFGNLISAYLISRLKTGKSPAEIGSGNPGTANIGAQLGKSYGILVLALDLLKTILAIILCHYLFPELGRLVILTTGLGVTLGHNFPFWLKFKGGKGVAVAVILVLLYNPLWGLVALLIALALLLWCQYLALGGIMILLADTILGIFFYPLEAWLILFVLLLIMVIRFYKDLKDIKNGTAKKVDLLKRFKNRA